MRARGLVVDDQARDPHGRSLAAPAGLVPANFADRLLTATLHHVVLALLADPVLRDLEPRPVAALKALGDPAAGDLLAVRPIVGGKSLDEVLDFQGRGDVVRTPAEYNARFLPWRRVRVDDLNRCNWRRGRGKDRLGDRCNGVASN